MQQVEDKIQKAREIYYRRNGIKFRGEKEKEKRHIHIGWILILIIVAGIYLYQNKEYLTSQGFKDNVKTFLNTQVTVDKIKEFFGVHKPEEKTEEVIEENKVENNSNLDDTANNQETQETAELTENLETTAIIWPFQGTITSGFGARESTDSRVTPNHTGIDIAGNER